MEYGLGRSFEVGKTQDVVAIPWEKTKCGSDEKSGIWGGYFVEKKAKKRRKSGVFFFEKTEKNLAI